MVQGEGLEYLWYKDGAPVANESAATARLVLSSPAVGDCGFYHVCVSNAAGSVQSTRVHVIVKPEAVKPLQPAGSLSEAPGRAGRAAARRRRMLAGMPSLPPGEALSEMRPLREECVVLPCLHRPAERERAGRGGPNGNGPGVVQARRAGRADLGCRAGRRCG